MSDDHEDDRLGFRAEKPHQSLGGEEGDESSGQDVCLPVFPVSVGEVGDLAGTGHQAGDVLHPVGAGRLQYKVRISVRSDEAVHLVDRAPNKFPRNDREYPGFVLCQHTNAINHGT